MQTKLLEEIVSDIVGKQAAEILKLLIGKKDVNEFLIAKKLKLTINQVRNILYKLANFSLVTFTRKKDKKKGWYTYFWTLDDEKALELLDKKLKKEIVSLGQQLKSRDIKRFYTCKICKTEISEETALSHTFSCPECGEVYELSDNKKIINELKNNITKFKSQRENVLEELGKIKGVLEKKRLKETRKFERAKKKAEKKKREERKAEKEREERKAGKKKVKKKAKKKKPKTKKKKNVKKKVKKKGKMTKRAKKRVKKKPKRRKNWTKKKKK